MIVPKPWRATRVVIAACCLALLAACSVLPEREPVQVWQPQDNTPVPSSSATPSANFSLRVDTPNANGPVSQTGIVVMPGHGRVSTYQGARWSMPPALLIRDRLVDAFLAAGLPNVTTDEGHFAADYTLSGDLRAFQSEYRAGSPVVVVRYDAALRRHHSRRPVASHSFVVTQRPDGTQIPQIVAAFGAADDKLAAQVVAWTIQIASRHQRPPPEQHGSGGH